MQTQLSEATEVNRVAQNSCRFLRSVKAHRILGHHEVDHELPLALVVSRRGHLGIGCPFRLLGLDVADQVRSVRQGAVLRRLKKRSLISSTLAFNSSSGKWWQVWQERLILSSGLLIWWSVIWARLAACDGRLRPRPHGLGGSASQDQSCDGKAYNRVQTYLQVLAPAKFFAVFLLPSHVGDSDLQSAVVLGVYPNVLE